MTITKKEILDQMQPLNNELQVISQYKNEVASKKKRLEELKKQQESLLSIEKEQEINTLETLLPKLERKLADNKIKFRDEKMREVGSLVRMVNDYKINELKKDGELQKLKNELKDAINIVVKDVELIKEAHKERDNEMNRDFYNSGLGSLMTAVNYPSHMSYTKSPLSHLHSGDTYYLNRLKETIDNL